MTYHAAELSAEVRRCEDDVQWRRRRDSFDDNIAMLSAVKRQSHVEVDLQNAGVYNTTDEVVVAVGDNRTNELRSRYVQRYFNCHGNMATFTNIRY